MYIIGVVLLLNLLLSVLNVSPLMCFGVDTAAVNAVGRAACRCVSAVVGHDIVHFGDGRVVCYKYLEIVGSTVHIVVGIIKAVVVDANAHARFALGASAGTVISAEPLLLLRNSCLDSNTPSLSQSKYAVTV